jgi:DUF1009 family protein
MLKVSDESRETLFRISIVEKAKTYLPKLKYHEVYNIVMTADIKDLLNLKTLRTKHSHLRIVKD